MTVHSMAIAAQLSIASVDLATPIRLEEELVMMKTDGSQTLRSVAANASDGILLAIKTFSTSSQIIDLRCFPEKKAATHQLLNLEPAELRVLPGCSGSATEFSFSKSESLHDLGAVGLSIGFSGKPGDVAVFGA